MRADQKQPLEGIISLITKSVEEMKYMKTSITGFTSRDIALASLDKGIQEFEQDLASVATKLYQVANGYAIAAPLGVTTHELQNKESELINKNDVTEYLKQHPVTVKAYEAFNKQLQSQIHGKINNLPSVDGLFPKINEIISTLNSPAVKEKLKDRHKDIVVLCQTQKSIVEKLKDFHTSVDSLKATVTNTYKQCFAKNKELAETANKIGSKLMAAGSAARERDARAAAGGNVHPAPDENKPRS